MTKEPKDESYHRTYIYDSLFWGKSHTEQHTEPSYFYSIRLKYKRFSIERFGALQVCSSCLSSLVIFSSDEGSINVLCR